MPLAHNTPPQFSRPPVTVREQLDAAGLVPAVDCFTLYTEDYWKPGTLIPHEIDPHLYYPESLYTSPLPEFHASIKHRIIESSETRSIALGNHTYRVLIDRHRTLGLGPGTPPSVLPQARSLPFDRILEPFRKTHPRLFGTFAQREDIICRAVIIPTKPILKGCSIEEVLFLNYRSDVWDALSTSNYIDNLCPVLDIIFTNLKNAIRSRVERMLSPAVRSLRTLHELLGELGNPVSAGHSRSLEEVCEDLAKTIHRQMRWRSPLVAQSNHPAVAVSTLKEERTIVSIYKLDASGVDSATLSNASPTQPADQKSVVLRKMGSEGATLHQKSVQPISGGHADASITVCATLTGNAILLQRVDEKHETHVAISKEEYEALTQGNHPTTLGLSKGTLLVKLPTDTRRGGGYVVYTPSDHLDPSAWSLNDSDAQLIQRTFGSVIPRLSQHLCVRSTDNYSRIFGDLDQDWKRPCAEVCVPIFVANHPVGCVNIESNMVDRFDPSAINMLMALAMAVGSIVHRATQDATLEDLRSVIAAIAAPRELGNSPVKTSDDPMLRLVVNLADAVLCNRLTIIARTGDPANPYEIVASSDERYGAGAVDLQILQVPEFIENIFTICGSPNARHSRETSVAVAIENLTDGVAFNELCVTRDGATSTAEFIPMKNQGFVDHAKQCEEALPAWCRLAIALPIYDIGNAGRLGVVWLEYVGAIALTHPTEWRHKVALAKYTELLGSVLAPCATLLTLAKSDFLREIQRYVDVAHSTAHQEIAYLGLCVEGLLGKTSTSHKESAEWLMLLRLLIVQMDDERTFADMFKKYGGAPKEEQFGSLVHADVKVNLREAFEQAWHINSCMLHRTNLVAEFSQIPQSLHVLGDSTAVRTVVASLVMNALTHCYDKPPTKAPPSGYHLRVRAVEDGCCSRGYPVWRIEVEDDGPGFASGHADPDRGPLARMLEVSGRGWPNVQRVSLVHGTRPAKRANVEPRGMRVSFWLRAHPSVPGLSGSATTGPA